MICLSFATSLVMPPAYAQSLMGNDLAPLPKPGTMVGLSSAYNPPILRGIKVSADDPLKFNFILDPGDKDRAAVVNGMIDPTLQDRLKETSNRLLKYFLTTLTMPDSDIWVNLSPYEDHRIIAEKFGQTEMGRDLLGQDYLLKQITASLMFPQGEAGKVFWARVYAEAQKKFGSTQIPVNTFNKVWVMPDKAVIYEKLNGGQATAYVVESRLKVMLESDYIATKKHEEAAAVGAIQNAPLTDAEKLSRDVARQVIIPILEKEVNEGENFAPLRQVYNSILLALWYKQRMNGSILSSSYVNRSKVAGVDVKDKAVAQKIWQLYVQAYKKGAFNMISEEMDPSTNEIMPRKYFAGGFNIDRAQLTTQYVNSVDQLSSPDRRSFLRMLGVGAAAVGSLGLVEVLAGCGGSSVNLTKTGGIFNFPNVSGINIAPVNASNNWGYNVSASNGTLSVSINYELQGYPNTYWTINANGGITFTDGQGTNNTYVYNTAAGVNILFNLIDILQFVGTLSPDNSTQLNNLISILKAQLPKPIIDMELPTYFNYNIIQAEYIMSLDAQGNLLLSRTLPDTGLGIPPQTSTDYINFQTGELDSYLLQQTPLAVTFLANTDEWTNNLYWILLDLQNALQVGQQGGSQQLTAAQLKDLNAWNTTITGWYDNGFTTPGISEAVASIPAVQPRTDIPKTVNKTVFTQVEKPANVKPAVPIRPSSIGTSPIVDNAMKGGIDLTRSSTPLDVRNRGGVINFNIDPAQVERIIASPGLSPQVYAVDPLQNLPAFLGMSNDEIQQITA